MEDKFNLTRFIEAQSYSYDNALCELKNGRKTSHWMWYIFPQLRGLGRSYNSNYYGLSGKDEALAYLENPILSERLRTVCTAILGLDTSDARSVFGGIDSHKLRSSMTIFDLVSPDDVFASVLDKYFDGRRDRRTMCLIEKID
ncbi:MAG: DUF1810 domain-containing protein [Muribaculum sp.]|nr:DUF1810 domain-containing protein [Muribaculum sp.]